MACALLIVLSTLCCTTFTASLRSGDGLNLWFDPQELTITFGASVNLSLWIDGSTYANFSVAFENEESEFVEVSPARRWFNGNDSFTRNVVPFEATGRRPGRFVVKASVEPAQLADDQRLFVRLKVALSQPLIYISLLIGWTYTACWSLGYYPQIWMNYRRKSVVGLSFDFLYINLVGHGCYAFFNAFMYWNSYIEQEYFSRHPYGLNPVIGNDVGFAVHAALVSIYTIVQCFLYETGGNSVSTIAKGIIILYFHIIIGAACAVWFGGYHGLDFLYVLSYIKLSTMLVKYFPQACLNYKRQSTEGFSIMNRLMDMVGGLLSIVQMVINAWNFDDWQSVLGDPVKFGLGLLSILFDLVFIVQHYFLYKKTSLSSYAEKSEQE